MPYYIYRVRKPQRLEYIDVKSKYKDAKSAVQALREEQADDDSSIVRMVFAKSPGEAEKLLSAPRDERVIGEE
jgi:hypothetical protein